ncbi:MAG TPA: DUF4139 domain-containing protein [Bacteroidia bacterium]|jgi:hypothetical protein|nr:DUF4139 domain-containing protein [Bacteroidia bacterium]
MKTSIATALLAIPILVSGQKEIETIAKINQVTLYTSSAEINYEKEMQLPKGKTTVVFTDLTPFIVENSVNVAVSDKRISIITVAERINFAKEKRNINEWVIGLQDSIVKMNKELGLLHCKEEVAEAEKSLLFKGEAIGGLSTHGVAVAEIEKASIFFNKRYYELSKDLYYLSERENDLHGKIKKCTSQLKELTTVSVQTTSEIKVTVNCPADEKVKFNFKFLTAKAGWAPTYDFKYEGPLNPLQFVFRANVFNASGVPWQEVAIKLSTADPIHGFSLPSLKNETKEDNPIQDVNFKQIEVVNAITEYTISHQYTVPSDAKPYLVDVNAYSMPASYNYLLIPKLDPFGFLMAKIPGWNKYNLIPGTTNIYNMGTYMGKTFMDTYAENDTLSVYLGKDKNIQSTRNEKNITHSRFLAGNYSIEETHTEISIKNTSNDVLPLEMIDQVPIVTKEDKEKLTVFNIKAANYNKPDGLLTWNFSVKGGETILVNYNYEIKSPKENYDSGPRHRKFRTIACPSF